MADKRVKECWVLLSDCRDYLQQLEAKKKQIATPHRNESSVKHFNFKGFRTADKIRKSARKKQKIFYYKSAAKRYLLQKYGESLLRKPSFSVETPNFQIKFSHNPNLAEGKVSIEKQRVRAKTVWLSSQPIVSEGKITQKNSVDARAKPEQCQSDNLLEEKVSIKRSFDGGSKFSPSLSSDSGFQKHSEAILVQEKVSDETIISDPTFQQHTLLQGKVTDKKLGDGGGIAPCLLMGGKVSDKKINFGIAGSEHLMTVMSKGKSSCGNMTSGVGTSTKYISILKKASSNTADLVGKLVSQDEPATLHKHHTNNVDSLKSDSIPEVILGDCDRHYTNPLSPMPSVGLIVNVGVGNVLLPQAAKCALDCLDECKDSLTCNFAEFCSAVVSKSPVPVSSRLILPVKNKRVLCYMRKKWQSKSVVKVQTFERRKVTCESSPPSESNILVPDKEHVKINNLCDVKLLRNKSLVKGSHGSDIGDESDFLTCKRAIESSNEENSSVRSLSSDVLPQKKKISRRGLKRDCSSLLNGKQMKRPGVRTSLRNLLSEKNKAGSDDEARSVVLKTVANFPDPPYDPDDTRGTDRPEDVTSKPRGSKGYKSSLTHELRRLNVAIFDISSYSGPVVCRTPDICRLGCVCSSLAAKVIRDNCGLENCMFECTCLDPLSIRKETIQQPYNWVQKKATANLAKEEQIFKQAVVRSGSDSVIHVAGKAKRKIKLPERYREDFFSPENERHVVKKAIKSSVDEDDDCGQQQQKTSMLVKTLPNKTRNNHESVKEPTVLSLSQTCSSSAEVSYLSPDAHASSNESRGVAVKSTSERIMCFSARTRPICLNSKQHRLEKRKLLLQHSSCEKVQATGGLQIESTKSMQPDEWDRIKMERGPSSGLKSCSVLFSPDHSKEVTLLSWEALRNDIVDKKIFLWLKVFKSKPKIYLTESTVKPSEHCLEFQSISTTSEEYKMLPFHLRSLRTDYLAAEGEGKCTWIAKYHHNYWMIVGYLQPGNTREESPKTNNELSVGTQDVDILSTFIEDEQARWWVMDITQKFDVIYFLDFNKAMTKAQISTLTKLSNEYAEEGENKVHRIVINRRRPKIDPKPVPYPDFGAYSLPNHPTVFLIGPYYSFKEPRILVYSKKVALNGKEEFHAVPLFYQGGGECVRVNSEGALSLQAENLPDHCVLGTWFPDFSKGTKDSIEGDRSALALVDSTGTNPASTSPQGSNEGPDSSDSSDEEDERCDFLSEVEEAGTQPLLEGSQPNSLEPENEESRESNRNLKTQMGQKRRRTTSTSEYYTSDSLGNQIDASKSLISNESSLSVTESSVEVNHGQKSPCKSSIPLSRRIRSTSRKTMPDSSQVIQRTKHDSEVKSSLHENVKIEYLCPSEPEIGHLLLTHLPRGAISVSHFTEPGVLTFYHSKIEVIRAINKLIHNNLACLSRKCAVDMKKNTFCKCVSWKSSDKEPKTSLFDCKIFNGFYILTKHGLVDLRTADDAVIRMLGKDWIEWLKNDEIGMKLAKWKAEQQVLREHDSLVKVLTSNEASKMTLPQVLQKATDEIAKLKAEKQLLDHENQAQLLLKETLVYSLCRKLNGIPASIVPNFLQHLSLDLLWEVLECMDSRNTLLLGSATTQSSHFSFDVSGASNNYDSLFQRNELSPSKMKPPLILRKSKPYFEISERVESVSSIGNQGQMKHARKQIFSNLPEVDEPIFRDELFEGEDSLDKFVKPTNTSETSSLNPETSFTLGSVEDDFIHQSSLNCKEPPVVNVSPSTSNSVCSIEKDSNPDFKLRISSVYSGADHPISPEHSYAEVISPPKATSQEIDPISSLRITSVYSGADPLVSSDADQGQHLTQSTDCAVSQFDPISSLRISSVTSGVKSFFSSPSVSNANAATKVPPMQSCLEKSNSVPSLHISSVYSQTATSVASGSTSNSGTSKKLMRVLDSNDFNKKFIMKPILQTVPALPASCDLNQTSSSERDGTAKITSINTTVNNLKHLSVVTKAGIKHIVLPVRKVNLNPKVVRLVKKGSQPVFSLPISNIRGVVSSSILKKSSDVDLTGNSQDQLSTLCAVERSTVLSNDASGT